MAIKALIGFVLVFAMGFYTGAIHGIRITTEKAMEIYDELEHKTRGEDS